ncbi:hypothetical protein [Pontiella sp.]|uniref:type II secretion system protein GspD n=1 Tax=Pontiella sp. TaxID=2837462 RepID=UPI00356A904D
MRLKQILFLVSASMVVSVFSQQGFEDIEDVMDELMNFKEEAPAEMEEPVASIVTPKPAVDPQPEKEARGVEPAPAPVQSVEAAQPLPPVSQKTETVKESKPQSILDKHPAKMTDEELMLLAKILTMNSEDLILLIDQADARQKEALFSLQELADIIENDPENWEGKKTLMQRLRDVPVATWAWVVNTSKATGSAFNNLPSATKNYFKDLSKDRDRRNHLDDDHRTAELEGIEAVNAAWSTRMVLRTYDLISGAAQRMKLGDVTSAVDVETLFSVVDFPKGSSAIYQPATDTIYVHNTVENLAVLESMLNTMGVLKVATEAYQVEIESKFVEVSEGTLEELGFQWNFDDPTALGSRYEMNDGPGGLFAEALRGSPNNSAGGTLPFQRTIDLGDGTVSASGDWSSFRFVDTLNTLPDSLTFQNQGGNLFDMVISALDQSTGADVLSAPRILTRNGEEAIIQVGEIHYFPEVYEGDSAQATLPNVSYEDFEERLLGVELKVTPKVTAERDIMLQLNPRISELIGWQTYQLAPENSIYNHRQLETSRVREHPRLVANLPIIKKREIQTQVTMADGSTIAMGGLINEKIESFDDRVPFLGSIPLVGRMFRNEGERVVKRNLIIFVNAKVVEPNGRIETTKSFE